MARSLTLALACLLAGCSSFNLGGMAYCPAKHDCAFQVTQPAKAASAP